MLPWLCRSLPVFTLMWLLASSGPATAQQKLTHPRLRAVLHELREARAVLKDARDTWPQGYKDRALQHIDDAIVTIKTILAVKNVDDFRGVQRSPDYYTRYKDHPRLRAALDDVRDARDELRGTKSDFGGLKDRALDDLDLAAGSIVTLIRYAK